MIPHITCINFTLDCNYLNFIFLMGYQYKVLEFLLKQIQRLIVMSDAIDLLTLIKSEAQCFWNTVELDSFQSKLYKIP